MDPNATLRRWQRAVEGGFLADAMDAARDLGAWMSRGGFAPRWGQDELPTEERYRAITRDIALRLEESELESEAD